MGQKAEEVNVYFYVSDTGMEKGLFHKHRDKLTCLNELKEGQLVSDVKELKFEEILKLMNVHKNVKYLQDVHKGPRDLEDLE